MILFMMQDTVQTRHQELVLGPMVANVLDLILSHFHLLTEFMTCFISLQHVVATNGVKVVPLCISDYLTPLA